MAIQLRSNFLDFFTEAKLPQLEAIIETKASSYASMIPLLFNQEMMSTDIYQTTTMSGLRNPQQKNEGEDTNFQTMEPGYDKTFVAVAYANGYRISREMVKDGKVNMMQKATESFAKGNFEIREVRAADIFDNAFTTNGPDGVPLCSVSHPLENGAGALGVNRPADASELSITSFRDLRNILQSTLNENGQRVSLKGQYFVVPQDLQDTAKEILKSQLNPENANNAVNTVYQMLSLLPGDCWQYLDDQDAFFIACNKMDHSLMFLDREALEVDSEYLKRPKVYELTSYTRFTEGFCSWRGIVGNPGV